MKIRRTYKARKSTSSDKDNIFFNQSTNKRGPKTDHKLNIVQNTKAKSLKNDHFQNGEKEMTINDGDRLLTPEETSKMLSVSPATLPVWRCTNRVDLPYIKIGRLIRYRLSDIQEFLQNNMKIHT